MAISPFDENGKMNFKTMNDSRVQADIYVQDNYGPSDNNSSDWAKTKKEDFKKALELSASENTDGSKWFINSASGYYADILPQFPNYASSAADLYPYFMSEMRNGKYRGIFLQDYVGDNSYKRIPAAEVIALAVPAMAIPSIPIPFTDKTMRQVALELELKAAKALAPNTNVKGEDMTRTIIDNNFKSWQYKISVKTEGPGKVLVDEQEISEKIVDRGTVVNLNAKPDQGYYLKEWIEDGVEPYPPYNPFRVDMNKNTTITARFVTYKPYTLYAKVDENSIGRGRVLIRGEEVSEIRLAKDERVDLYAEAFDGYTFSGWKDSKGHEYYDNPHLGGGNETYTASFGLKSSDDILLSSEIQVSEDGRKVRFTKGNLYFYKENSSEGSYDFYDLQYALPQIEYNSKYWLIAYFFPASIKDPEKFAYSYSDIDGYWSRYHVDRELFANYLIGYNNKMLRTLSYEEWRFILQESHSKFSSDNPVSYNEKMVNGHRSLVLFPSNWTDEELFYAPTVEGKVWEEMERKGAVCLVLNGYREYEHTTQENTCGYYLTSFESSSLGYINLPGKSKGSGVADIGGCVRLVYDVD